MPIGTSSHQWLCPAHLAGGGSNTWVQSDRGRGITLPLIVHHQLCRMMGEEDHKSYKNEGAIVVYIQHQHMIASSLGLCGTWFNSSSMIGSASFGLLQNTSYRPWNKNRFYQHP